jgi:hypothetical protein
LDVAVRARRVEQRSGAVIDPAACGTFGLARSLCAVIDAAPTVVVAAIWLGRRLADQALPPEEVVASWLLDDGGGLGGALGALLLLWLVWSEVGIALWGRTPGMRALGLAWGAAPRWRFFARPPLFLISLLPLGLGGTLALLDRNGRGGADHLLKLWWKRA